MSYLKPIEISKFDKNRWVVSTPQGNHLLINEKTKDLLIILKESVSSIEALSKFNSVFDQNLDIKSFDQLIKNKFQNSDVLLSDGNVKFKKRSYMSLKVKLLNKKIAGLIASPFSLFYNPYIFWILLSSSVFWLTYLGWTGFTFDKSLIQPRSALIYTIVLYSTMLVHEVGHIAACRRFGIEHGEIGFGFYSIFPVVYADVSKIWTLNKHKRTITNLGGVYLELLYANFWTLVYLHTKETVFLAVCISIAIKTLTELNPFIRYDGYWVLSDLTNTPNLLPKANGLIRNVFSKTARSERKSNKSFKWLKKHYLIFSYGLVNWGIISVYIIWILIEKWQGVLSFPKTIFSVFNSILQKDYNPLISFFNWNNVIILGFYVLIIKLILRYGSKKFKRNRSVTGLDLNGLGQAR